jgi:hypothetical protein
MALWSNSLPAYVAIVNSNKNLGDESGCPAGQSAESILLIGFEDLILLYVFAVI